MNEKIESAIQDLQNGKLCLIYNLEEKEVSLCASALKMEYPAFEEMKRVATSDILITLEHHSAKDMGLVYLTDMLSSARTEYPKLNKFLKKNSSWALPIDHKDVVTGSSDDDKLLTIHELAKVVESKDYDQFAENFIAPGHVRVFIARPGLLDERKGHTELSIAMLELANLPTVAVISSMRDLVTFDMLSLDDAREYAKNYKVAMLEEGEIVEAYNSRI